MAEEVIGLPMGITLAEAMNSWISHRGYPIVSVMRQYKEGTAIIRQVCDLKHYEIAYLIF